MFVGLRKFDYAIQMGFFEWALVLLVWITNYLNILLLELKISVPKGNNANEWRLWVRQCGILLHLHEDVYILIYFITLQQPEYILMINFKFFAFINTGDSRGTFSCTKKGCKYARRVNRVLTKNRGNTRTSLLHEIDSSLVLAKGFLLRRGTWGDKYKQDLYLTSIPNIYMCI